MPRVEILLTEQFLRAVACQPAFFREVRVAVATMFATPLAGVAVTYQRYAPGCEDEHPGLAVTVTINEGNRAAKLPEITQELADRMKPIADRAIRGNAGPVKGVVDIGLRRSAMAGA